MHLYIDFESRSPIDIKKCGAHVYAEHPDTEVLCLAVKVDNATTAMWIPKEFREYCENWELWSDDQIFGFVLDADRFHAHNASFERCMWTEHMVRRRGFPKIQLSKWDDTAARAAMCALPRSLDAACKALGVSQQKDEEGYKLMLKMCKPKPLTKAEREKVAATLGMTEEAVQVEGRRVIDMLKVDPYAPKLLHPRYKDLFKYHFNQEDFERLCQYCIQDVEAEYALGKVLPPLSGMERRIWELDQVINDRGIMADMSAASRAQVVIDEHEEKLQQKLKEITKGKVTSAKAVAKFGEWLTNQGAEMDDLRKQTVKDALKDEADPVVRQALEIRQSLSMSSTAKLAALRACTCRDGRMRGSVVYHGAATGRWTGKGFQPQNLPRGNEKVAPHQDAILSDWLTTDLIDFWGDPMDVVSTCLRGLLIASPDHDLIAADYSAIEGRGLAWLAGEEHVLEGYRRKLDPYKVAASGIYKIPYEQIQKPQRQVGKICELALGFQGSHKAMLAFGADRLGMMEEEMKDAVAGWREASRV